MAKEAARQLQNDTQWLNADGAPGLRYLVISGSSLKGVERMYLKRLTLAYKRDDFQNARAGTLLGDTLFNPVNAVTGLLPWKKANIKINVFNGLMTIIMAEAIIKLDLEYKNEIFYAGNGSAFYSFSIARKEYSIRPGAGH